MTYSHLPNSFAIFSIVYFCKQMVMADLVESRTTELAERMREKLKGPPWNDPDPAPLVRRAFVRAFPSIAFKTLQPVSTLGLFLYDAAYLFFLALNETLANGEDYRDGRLMMEKVKYKNFIGMSHLSKAADSIFDGL
jgi:hypothetical protein